MRWPLKMTDRDEAVSWPIPRETTRTGTCSAESFASCSNSCCCLRAKGFWSLTFGLVRLRGARRRPLQAVAHHVPNHRSCTEHAHSSGRQDNRSDDNKFWVHSLFPFCSCHLGYCAVTDYLGVARKRLHLI